MRTEIGFAHRLNRDESFDSICLGCYLTIATTKTEEELARYESFHLCADDHFEAQQKRWKQRMESPFDVLG
jgi:hypothetical protein